MRAKLEDKITANQRQRSLYRAHLVVFLWFLFACIVVFRAFYVQVVKHNYYTSLADKQYVSTTPINFDRGTIFFSHYNKEVVPVAQLRTTYRITIDPTQIKDPESLYEKLSKALPANKSIDKTTFLDKASKKNDPYEEIVKDIPSDIVTLLKSQKLQGVNFVKDNKRSYTQESIGSKVIGFVGNDGVSMRGQYGLERYYNDVLNRDSGDKTINFFAELFTDIQKTIVSNKDIEQGDIILTIDSEAERALHNALVETKEKWQSDTIGGIVMDPQTGAIIAMDGLPSFDPNDYSHEKDSSVFLNQNISGVYEMGSIMKPLTMASAIDSGAINEASTTYNDTGFRDLNGFKVRNYDSKARGKNTSMQKILDESLNVGIVFLVEQLGAKRFQDYFKKFGIGEETGIDLPGEASGLTKNLDSKVFVDSATAGFGQGIAVTPIQTIRALAALGNGGKLVTPHVVDSIIYQNGTTKKIVSDADEQVISKDTSERTTRMLVHVVDTSLMHGADKMEHYSVAAKTGTAQMPKPGGGYYDDRYLHSFFGYFPAYDPKYIIFLFHTHPKGAEYASATLTDPFYKMVKFLISYYEVPPDR
ncbi:MAG: penicillin-binding protein 2 [Candidatus Paceibacterota bacterium]|jgi:cell division protein FtsI/penicillin-binding protein 2